MIILIIITQVAIKNLNLLTKFNGFHQSWPQDPQRTGEVESLAYLQQQFGVRIHMWVVFILGESYEICGYLRWSLQSAGSSSNYFLYFVCPLISPTLPQSTKHAQTCAHGLPASFA